jgi:tRNA(fMet)-specific endonuclease VapC
MVLDTNIVIEFLNGNVEIIDRLLSVKYYFLPFVVCGELLFGAADSSRKNHNLKNVKIFINECTVIDSNLMFVEHYANTRKQLKTIGRPIPENDIWIADVCISYNLPLFTHDAHFKNVKGIKLI